MDQEKLQKMQFLEQNLQAVYMQKQAFQMEISETNSALIEIEKTDEAVYKMVGQLMIKQDKEKILSELKDKDRLLKTRIEALGKQEEKLSEEVKKLRDELVASQK